MNPTWKAAIGVILIFILGWFGGALVTLVIVHHRMNVLVRRDPVEMATLLERQTTRGLDLNDDQKNQIHDLLVENLRSRMQLQKQIQPQVQGLNSQTVHAIDALLSSAQQQKFQDNLFLFKERFGRNPLNTGLEDKATVTISPSAATNSSVGNAPSQ